MSDTTGEDVCEGLGVIGTWAYEFDRMDDDAFPFRSYGELLLRSDGELFQRNTL